MSGTNDEEINVALTANFSDLAEGMQAGADSVVEGTQTMASAVAESSAAMSRSYQEIIDAQNRQMVSTAAFFGEQSAAATEATAAIQGQTAATAELGVISGGVAREVGVLSGEAMRGNFTRMEGSLVTLANRAGLLQAVFSPLGVSILAAAGAGGVLIDEFVKAEERASSFQAALLATGDASGMSAGELMAAANNIAAFSGNASAADEIVIKLASSGKMSGQALVDAGTAAANIMRLTGESAEQAAKQVEALADNPAKAVVELNNKFHFLTVEVYDHITALQATGHAYEATEVAAKAFADDTSDRVQQLNEQMGYFEQMMSHMKEGWSAIDHAMQKALDPTLAQKSVEVTHQWFVEQTQLNQAIKNGASADDITILRERAEASRQYALQLRAQVTAQNDANASAGKTAAAAAGTIREEQEQAKLNDHLKETSLLQEKIAEEKQRVESIHAEDPGSATIKGIQFDASGAIAGGEQWDAIVKKLTKDYGETGDAARKAAAAARKAAGEAMNDLEIQRAKTEQYSQARIADDEKIVQAALTLYGKDSTQYKEALNQKLRDEQELAKQQLQTNVQLLDQKKSEYDRDNANAVEAAKLQFDQGKITAQQLAAIETELAKKKMDADVAFVTAQENLYAQAGAAEAQQAQKAAADIVKIHQDATNQLTKIQDQAVKAGEKDWNGYASAIGNSMKSAVTGMLFQGNTLKQGIEGIGQSMVGTFIDKSVDKMVAAWGVGEDDKTLATAVGESQRTALQAAGAKQGMAISAAMNEKQIANAAYTGAANAYQALAGIPIIGPVLGAAAAVATFAGIEAYDNIASAAGGWGQVPSDQLAMIHKDEMILPAHIADPLRHWTSVANGANGNNSQSTNNSTTNNGGDTHIHFNISAMDAKSFRTALNGGLGTQLATYVKQKTQNSPQVRR